MSDESEDFPFVITFVVLSAFLVAMVFLTVYSRQAQAKIEEEATNLLSRLSWSAFQSFSSGVLGTVELPRDLCGYRYSVEVEGSSFKLTLHEGPLRGKEYVASVPVKLFSENFVLPQGGVVFFRRIGEVLLISTSGEYEENISVRTSTDEPPVFYFFAKSHPREAAGIIAAFLHSGEDIRGFAWMDNSHLGLATEENRYLIAAFCKEDYAGWNVESFEAVKISEGTGMGEAVECPSPAEAFAKGWIISQNLLLASLRSRTWVDENGPVAMPHEIESSIGLSLTKAGGYPTWRIIFDGRILFYRAIPWWYADNDPGFLMQSYPPMYPLD